MVFFHGGSLVVGGAMMVQAANGATSSMASRGPFVSVSVNYRLGVAGYLAVDALAEGDERGGGYVGNYGVLDCIQALQWVQENARSFGGDPSKVTIYGQSSGGSLVLALLSSPRAAGLYSAAISMSGSPRLNSTIAEAASYWHREPVLNSRCGDLLLDNGADAAELRTCLYSLTTDELVLMMPDNWDAASFSFDVFQSTYQYAPLLLIDGKDGECGGGGGGGTDGGGDGGTLPCNYLNASWEAVPIVLGVTRQEIDFAPGDDVRNMSRSQLGEFVATKVGPFYSDSFVAQLLELYGLVNDDDDNDDNVSSLSIPSMSTSVPRPPSLALLSQDDDNDGSNELPFQAQRTYAEIVTDATVFCPTLPLAWAIDGTPSSDLPLYLYSTPQVPALESGYCPLAPYQAFDYCPEYSFHAIDMFMLFLAEYPSYSIQPNSTDVLYSEEILRDFRQLATIGAIPNWTTFDSAQGADGDHTYSVVDLQVDSAEHRADGSMGTLKNFKREKCNLFLSNGFYQEKAWVN
jgi:carboxylesterase type B